MILKSNLSIVHALISLFTIALSSCASAPSYYQKNQSDPTFIQEKEILRKRMNGNYACTDANLASFLTGTKTPNKECLYLNLVAYDGVTVGTDVTVFQTLPKGFILNLPYQSCDQYGCINKIAPNLIFLHRSDEKEELIDNKKLTELYPWDFYEYVGPYSYQSMTGLKTVYSFKRVSIKEIGSHQIDFKKYTVWLEIYSQMGAWKNLRDLEGKIEEKQKKN